MGKPELLSEMDNDNGTDNTIKRGIIYTNVKKYTWKIQHKFWTKIDRKNSIGTPIIEAGKFSIAASFDINKSQNT